MPNGRTRLEVADERGLRLGGVLLGVHAQVDRRARVRGHGVERAVDRRHVDAGDGDRRARPHARAEVRRCPAAAGRSRPRRARGTRPRCRTRPPTPRAAGPSTATSPLASCSVASACSSDDQRVRAPRRRTARCAWRRRSVVTSIVTIAMPRSATVSVGTPGRTLPMSPMTIASHRKASGCSGRVGRQRAAADLLLALDHDLDPDRRAAVPRAQRADVSDHVRLGVGGAAAEDRAVALGRRRTAASSTAPRRRPARRRNASTAARSGRPRAPGSRR